ncbi:uncharacterized protein METZ01_LOCUS274767 [marine metagenome]|uniref:Uncharacterized protein n=1 Tax=marine metagenome TaxID=408172 RepID=A0A382KEP6_9ZZZZ
MSGIEKTSLEAHVEICGERYTRLEDKLDEVVRRIERSYVRFDKMEQSLSVIKEYATNHHTDRFKAIDDKQIALDVRISNVLKLILSGAILIIGTLVAGIFTLLP